MGELREAAHLGRDGAGEIIDCVEEQRGELREAADLGRDGAGELIVVEEQIG